MTTHRLAALLCLMISACGQDPGPSGAGDDGPDAAGEGIRSAEEDAAAASAGPRGIEITPLPEGIIVEKDVSLQMSDGVHLSVNLFRPEDAAPVPVVMAFTAYGKDLPPEIGFIAQEAAFQELGLSFGDVRISEETPFEAPDPAYWVPRGYAVLHVDVRGFGKSEGSALFGVFDAQQVRDFGEVIEWAGTQPWSNGKVGLLGVSYLAISQWYAAQANPPHLAAIVPWEGASDLFRDVLFHGGIPAMPGPGETLPPLPSAGEAESTFRQGGGLLAGIPTALVKSFVPAPRLADIQVPALICGSYSDHGLHTKGSFDAYRRIGSEQKWLYTHGGGKWERFYGEDELEFQQAFLDHFLKGEDNGMDRRPRVRLEVRETRDEYEVREENDWPLPSTDYRPLFLHAEDGALRGEQSGQEAVASYDSVDDDEAFFDLRITERTEVTGHMKLKLWVSTSEGNDMDLFVGVKKLDAEGAEVPFWGTEKNPYGVVAQGWLRVSHRELDPERSTPYQPVLTHDRELKLSPGEIVSVEIEILPSSTVFLPGETLRLVVRGTDAFSTAYHRHTQLLNRGSHSLHTGGSFDSHLLVPVIP